MISNQALGAFPPTLSLDHRVMCAGSLALNVWVGMDSINSAGFSAELVSKVLPTPRKMEAAC